MNFIENLSLSSGLQARRPVLSESFFPVVSERYITIHTENHQSKQWDHLQEFIDLIKPILKKENIQIIELGWNKVPLGNIDFSIKQADPKQAAYIISKSLLHLGVENLLVIMVSELTRYMEVKKVRGGYKRGDTLEIDFDNSAITRIKRIKYVIDGEEIIAGVGFISNSKYVLQ